jgi:c-di-GMP-binding flagellar brake protein YcgR
LAYFFEEVDINHIKPGLPLKIEVSSTNEFSGGEFKSTVDDIQGDLLKAGMPSLKGRFVPIPIGMMARISAVDQSSVYVFYASVLSNGEENGMTVTTFKLRSTIRRVQRRRFLRFEFIMNGTLKVAGTDQVYDFMTKDISAGGLRILMKANVDLGQIVLVTLDIDENLKLHDQQSQIVRKNDVESSELSEYGLTFLNMTSSFEDRMTRFVFKLELKSRGGKDD